MRTAVLISIILISLSSTGCKSVYYHERMPILEKPLKPKLDNIPGSEVKKMSPLAQKVVAENFNKLIDYSKKLEIAVDVYNKHALEKNQQFMKKKDSQ